MIEVMGRRALPHVGGVPWWRRAFGWLRWPVGLSMARPDGLQQPHTGSLAGTSQDGWAQRREVAHAPTAAGGPDPVASAHGTVDALYRQHAQTVLTYLYHRLPTLADAEDALADVFVAALRESARGQAPSLLWLMRVARNRSADYYRAAGRRATAPVGINLSEMPSDPALGPEQRALLAEERRELAALVATLPEEQREALLLRFGAGMRSAQIAGVLGKSDEATRALISRALRRLRKEWRA